MTMLFNRLLGHLSLAALDALVPISAPALPLCLLAGRDHSSEITLTFQVDRNAPETQVRRHVFPAILPKCLRRILCAFQHPSGQIELLAGRSFLELVGKLKVGSDCLGVLTIRPSLVFGPGLVPESISGNGHRDGWLDVLVVPSKWPHEMYS